MMLGQPFVRQKSWLAAARRRWRRMALARPVRDVVALRESTGSWFLVVVAGARTVSSRGCDGLYGPLGRPVMGTGADDLVLIGAGAESCSYLRPLGVE
jgi:hypothetical protein